MTLTLTSYATGMKMTLNGFAWEGLETLVLLDQQDLPDLLEQMDLLGQMEHQDLLVLMDQPDLQDPLGRMELQDLSDP
jgi:hypothetical protein